MSAPGPGPDDAGSGGAGPASAAADVVKRPEPGTTGSAGPALPPGCRGILVLRALRLGALLAVVALLGLLYVWRREIGLLASHQLLTILACVVIAVCGALVVGSERVERAEAATTGLIAAGTALAIAIHLARAWWADYPRTTVTSPVYLITAAALLALAALAVVSIALCRARTRLGARRRAPDDPARWRRLHRPDGDERGAGESAPSPSESAALRRGPAARTPTTTGARTPVPLRLTDRALLAVVALLPVLTLTAGALVPTALLDPATRTTAPADSELPARPAVPGGDGEGGKKIDWTYNVGTLLDVVAGTAGPIVLTPEGVTALNDEDGSVRWTYRRDASYVNGHGEQVDRHSPPYSENALTASPDARHVAVRIEGPGIIVSVVLDSTTGEVTAEHRSTFRSPLQMTDSLAVDGNEAFALDGGKTLWTMPEGTFGRRDSGSWDKSYSGTAGHSTVIVGMEKSCLTDNRFCKTSRTLRVAPDHDPTATTEITHVLRGIGPEYNTVENVTVVDGWVARSTDDDARTTPDEYADLAWETQAVNLDALASGEEAAPVPLGSASGMNMVASHASGTLVTATLLDRPAKNGVIDESTVSWAEAVLDPATGTATPASEYPGLAAARVGLRTTVVDTQATTSVVIEPADGGPGVSAPVPPGTLIEPWKPADSRNDAENETENDAEPLGKASSNVIAMTVPAATTIVIRSKLSGSDLPIVSLIYGMAGEDR